MVRSTVTACPDCFTNLGFRETAKRFAQKSAGRCPQCATDSNLKLTRRKLEDVLVEFFVGGSYISETYAPVYQVNALNPDPAPFDPTLATDAALACRITGQVVFHYGPPLWRLGMTDHYYEFEAGGERRLQAAREVVRAASPILIPSGTPLFRIRLNANANEQISTPVAFDPPPSWVQRDSGRWDEPEHPVLYVADDIELCLHECRASISDEIIVAAMHPTRDLRLLDLSAQIPGEPRTPFDDMNIFVGVMSISRGPWLEYCRAVANAARAAGFDGIRYTSYYDQAKHASKSLNLAIFGRPLTTELLSLQSINRLRISDLSYKFLFGPVLYRDKSMEAELAEMKTKWQEIASNPEDL